MNTIEQSTMRSPSGKGEICAKIIVDDITTPFVFHGVTTVDELYTLSFHVYSESTGSVAIGSDSFDTESKWKYCTSEFTASGEDLRLYFTTTGIYYLYETKLESGNKATDWTPAPEDTTDDINSVKAIATQTSTMFNWLVEGNADDKTSLTLTSTMAELIADKLVIKDSTGSSTIISGGKMDIDKIFAREITATGTIKGVKLEGATGSFSGSISASKGNFGFLYINNDVITAESNNAYHPNSKMQLSPWLIMLEDTDTKYRTYIQPNKIEINPISGKQSIGDIDIQIDAQHEFPFFIGAHNGVDGYDGIFSVSSNGNIFLGKTVGIVLVSDTGFRWDINSLGTKIRFRRDDIDAFYFDQDGTFAAGNKVKIHGNTELSNNNLTFSHGGGWYMSDATWVRSLNNISIYTGGKVRGDGGLEVHGLGNSGGQVKMLYGDYGVMLRNDGSSFYLLQTAKGDSGGTWNSYRPFYVNLSSGQVGINGSIFQTDMTMIRGGSYALSFRLSSSNNHVFRPTTTAGADADNIVYLGAGASRFHTVYATNGVKSSSDERDKNVFGLDERHKQLLMSLRVISYTWKDDDSKIHVGVSAQQTEKALVSCGFNPDTFGALEHDFWDIPHADGRTDRYSVNYDEIEMLMLPVVQEHEKRLGDIEYSNETQETVINQLLDENASLKKRIEQLENKLIS